MIYAFDIDGVLCDFTGTFSTVCGDPAKMKQSCMSRSDFDRFTQIFPQWFAQITQHFPSFWLEMERMCSDEEAERLREIAQRHMLYFVSSRPCWALEPTRQWLKEQFNINPNLVLVPSLRHKFHIWAGLGVDVAVEDDPRLDLYAATSGMALNKLRVPRRPYNQELFQSLRLTGYDTLLELPV